MIDTLKKLGFTSAVAALLLSAACSGEQPPKQTFTAQVTTEVEVVTIAPVAEPMSSTADQQLKTLAQRPARL